MAFASQGESSERITRVVGEKMVEVIVALREVTKAYPGTVAARNVSIEFRRGEIHGVVGENGAGKSTLVKILAGLIQPDNGHIEVANLSCRFANPRASLQAGIGVVHQAGSLIETLTAQENLELGRLFGARNSNQRRLSKAPVLLPGVPLDRKVNMLTMRQRQLVEIHRLMLQDAQLLVLDEPTAALTKHESALLFRDLEALAKAGHGIVVISHKLPELVSHCHRFTVLRKGQIVASLKQNEATVSELVRLCSGSQKTDTAPAANGPTNPNDTRPLMQFKSVSTASVEDEPLVAVDLVLRSGEILGIAGRSGSGVLTLLKLLRNQPVTLVSGTIERNEPAPENPGDPAIGYVPADRVAEGVILDFTIAENLKLRRRGLLGQIAALAHRQEQRKFVESLITRFDIKPARPDEKLRNLSGGNMQKVLLARELDHSKMLLIVASPTAGLDMGSASFVRRLLRQKANEGACVVIHSDDLDELTELSHRVIVMIEGKCAAELSGDEINSDSLGLALSAVNVSDSSEGVAVRRTQRSEAACAD
jgi:general nucleoside transport system ATP-binding protein